MQIMQSGGKSVLNAALFFGKRDEKGGETPRSYAKCGHTAKA